MQDPDTNDSDRRLKRRETRHGGIRFVGIFVPWQAVALTLALLVGVTAVAASRDSGPGAVRVEQASSDATADEVPSSTTTTDVQPATTTTEAPVTTTTLAPTTTTTRPATTTTTIAPGSSEVVIHGGGVSWGTGMCNTPSSDWARVAGCPEQPRQDLDFTLDASRYPKGSEFRLDTNVALEGGTTYCVRLFDLDRNNPVAGSEQCWSAPYVAPTPVPEGQVCCITAAPQASFSGQAGPMTFPAGRTRYTIQARAIQTSTGAGCFYHSGCSGSLNRAKVVIEWG